MTAKLYMIPRDKASVIGQRNLSVLVVSLLPLSSKFTLQSKVCNALLSQRVVKLSQQRVLEGQPDYGCSSTCHHVCAHKPTAGSRCHPKLKMD